MARVILQTRWAEYAADVALTTAQGGSVRLSDVLNNPARVASVPPPASRFLHLENPLRRDLTTGAPSPHRGTLLMSPENVLLAWEAVAGSTSDERKLASYELRGANASPMLLHLDNGLRVEARLAGGADLLLRPRPERRFIACLDALLIDASGNREPHSLPFLLVNSTLVESFGVLGS